MPIQNHCSKHRICQVLSTFCTQLASKLHYSNTPRLLGCLCFWVAVLPYGELEGCNANPESWFRNAEFVGFCQVLSTFRTQLASKLHCSNTPRLQSGLYFCTVALPYGELEGCKANPLRHIRSKFQLETQNPKRFWKCNLL